MRALIFYVTDLSKISEKFLEKTGMDITQCENIFVSDYMPYDGWRVEIIY